MINYARICSVLTYLEEAELLAGVDDGAADLVAAAGKVDDGQGDSGGGGRREKVGRDDEGVWERRMGRGQVAQILHGKLGEGKGTRVPGFRPEKKKNRGRDHGKR